ncbi:unnamed protein product [Ophioblennius macclurei]
MAAGEHVGRRQVFKVSRNTSNGFLWFCLHAPADKNMKQVDIVNKEELDKDSFQVNYKKHSPVKAKRLSACKRKSGGAVEVSKKLHRRSSDVGYSCDPGMANKENELRCSDDVRGIYYNDNCGLPMNSAEASKMAGASSKYSDFTELSKDHEAMVHVLFERHLRLKAALTLWQKNASELVSYLLRIEDKAVLIDCLPVLTNNLQSEAPCLSLGCCVDLMPQVKVILGSKYEAHINVGLHWVQSVIKKWWPELSKKAERQRACLEKRNIEAMRQQLNDLWEDGARLCSVPGSTGELAKAVEAYLSRLR